MNATMIHPRRRFTFNAPGAGSVLLAGDFTRWLAHPVLLKRKPNGTWVTTVSLRPGTYYYRFLIDGKWRDGPECRIRVEPTFGRPSEVLETPGNRTDEKGEICRSTNMFAASATDNPAKS